MSKRSQQHDGGSGGSGSGGNEFRAYLFAIDQLIHFDKDHMDHRGLPPPGFITDDVERQQLVENVCRELDGVEFKISLDRKCNTTLEKLLLECSADRIGKFIAGLDAQREQSPDDQRVGLPFLRLACSVYGSRVLESVFSRLLSIYAHADDKKSDHTVYHHFSSEVSIDVVSKCIIAACQELQNSIGWGELFFHTHGSCVLRSLLCLLTGVRVFLPGRRTKRRKFGRKKQSVRSNSILDSIAPNHDEKKKEKPLYTNNAFLDVVYSIWEHLWQANDDDFAQLCFDKIASPTFQVLLGVSFGTKRLPMPALELVDRIFSLSSSSSLSSLSSSSSSSSSSNNSNSNSNFNSNSNSNSNSDSSDSSSTKQSLKNLNSERIDKVMDQLTSNLFLDEEEEEEKEQQQQQHSVDERGSIDLVDQHIKERYKRAFFYYQLAAEASHAKAFLKIGDYLYYGRGGVDVNYEKAVAFYQYSSDRRIAQASYNIGYMHEHGQGLAKDYYLAKRYYDLAATQHKDAFLPASLALGALAIRYVYENGLPTADILEALNLSTSRFEDFSYQWDTFLIIFLSTILVFCLAIRFAMSSQ